MQFKNKAIVGAIGATAVGAAVVMTGASSAYFFDAEQAAANTITAGSLDLEYSLAGSAVKGGKVVLENVKPGDSETLKVTVKNAGTVDGFLSIDAANIQDLESGVLEPETGDTDATGELGDTLQVWLDGKWLDLPLGDLDDLNEFMTKYLANAPLKAGKSATVELKIKAPYGKKGDYNNIMSDTYSYDLDMSLSQQPER
jgi:hypothetical protein